MNVPLRELHLFAGAGGGVLGGLLLGHVPVCAVELEEYPRSILIQRQRDGIFPWFPVWDDVRTFDGEPWRGLADVVCGGWPCQDISAAGKGVGIEGERSGLWSEFVRIIGEVRPRICFMENSPMLTTRGLGRVLGDLATLGYDAEWCVLGADDLGAPHRRERIWILAHAQCVRPYPAEDLGFVESQGAGEFRSVESRDHGSAWWDVEPGVDRMAIRLAHRVERLRSVGNGQVPAVAASAFRTLYQRIACGGGA